MRALLVVGLALVASAAAFAEVGAGYHQEVGIPLYEKLKAAEEKLLAETAQNRVVGGSVAPNNAHPYFVSILIITVQILIFHIYNLSKNHVWEIIYNSKSLYRLDF